MKLPSRVTIVEVGTRDGLQNIPRFLPTADKIKLVNALAGAGLRRIEATSFVHPRAVPQLADAEALMAGIQREPGVRCSALVPNERGAQRALASRVDEITLVVSASESHNRSNVRCGVQESLAGFVPIMAMARQAGVLVRGAIGTSFGCPFEGNVPPERVVDIARRYLKMGVDEICLADTTGMANPVQVARLVEQVRQVTSGVELSAHFHNTRGAGLANVLAALQSGVTVFDASLGGLGGCPFAPGATGNICTEDLVQMLEPMGVETGVNLEALLAVAGMAQEMLGLELPGQVLKAGPVSCLHPMPMPNA